MSDYDNNKIACGKNTDHHVTDALMITLTQHVN